MPQRIVFSGGKMHADVALSSKARNHLFKNSSFDGSANLLVCASLDAGNIAAFAAVDALQKEW